MTLAEKNVSEEGIQVLIPEGSVAAGRGKVIDQTLLGHKLHELDYYWGNNWDGVNKAEYFYVDCIEWQDYNGGRDLDENRKIFI